VKFVTVLLQGCVEMSLSYSSNGQIFLWKIAWFWFGVNPVLALLFSNHLYWVSAANSSITIFLGVLFILMHRLNRNKILSRHAKWVFIYLGWIALSTLLSPYAHENFLRSVGLFSANLFWIIIVLIGSRWFHLEHALFMAGRAFVLGTIIITLVLLGFGLETSGRFGNDELLHPNFIGVMYGALCFILFIPIYRIKILQLALRLGFVLLMFLTFSKTSLISAVAAVCLGILFQRGWHRAKFILGISIVGVIVVYLLGDYIQLQLQDYLGNPNAKLLSQDENYFGGGLLRWYEKDRGLGMDMQLLEIFSVGLY